MLTVWPAERVGALQGCCRVTDEEGADLAYQSCSEHRSKGLFGNAVYYLGPAWGFVVGIHGYPTQASSDVSCSGRFSYWGAGTSITPELAMGKAHPRSVHFGAPDVLPTTGTCPLNLCHS